MTIIQGLKTLEMVVPPRSPMSVSAFPLLLWFKLLQLRLIFQRRYLFHLLFWLTYAVFMILEMQWYIVKKGWLFVLGPLFSSLAIIAVVVYGNTLFLIPRFLEKKKIVWYIAGIIIAMIGYTYIRSAVQQYWEGIIWPDEPMTIQSYFKWNHAYAWLLVLISTMLYFTQKWTEQRQQVKNIQINQLETELKYLRAQVNPHFLFNGLNTIYGNIDIKDQKARDILLLFADLLRYNLYEADVDWVELEKESVYLQNYVALQRARSNENMQIELQADIEDPEVKIAPLLFIPFVENAFKYSTHDDNSPNRIRISLQQAGNRITFECFNTHEEHIQSSGGIGLTNVTRRLELLYKDRYTLDIKKEASTYTVQLILLV